MTPRVEGDELEEDVDLEFSDEDQRDDIVDTKSTKNACKQKP
jgi:hypothetical protein